MSSTPGFLRDLLAFAWRNKIWWLAPLVLTLLLVVVLMLLGGSSAAPFMYTD